jgi:hypothetical protein
MRRRIAASGQQPGNRNILVDIFPMQADAADFDARTFFRLCAQQARKPRQRHAERAPVGQVDPHGVIVKANLGCRNAHATPSGSAFA